jgi:hypothetical protein
MENSYRSLGKILIAFIALLILVIGIYFYEINKNAGTPRPTESGAATTTPAISTYTNSQYGFTFNYPSNWQLTESPDKTSVTIDAGITANGLDAFTLVFTIIPNDSFQSVQTKVGNIIYDPTQNALVDTNETPARCLPYADLRGLAGGAGNLSAFNYGGSIMSDPAYWESEILTNKNYMLDVGESYERPSNDATNQIIQTGENEIYSSLAFTNNVVARTPVCASDNNQ